MKKQSIKTPRFRTWYNHNEIPYDAEYNSGELVTIPHQSYTIREIFEKFGNGQALPIQKHGSFEDEPSFDEIDPTRSPDFDLADLTELQNTLPDKIETLKKRIASGKDKTKAQDPEVKRSETPGANADVLA